MFDRDSEESCPGAGAPSRREALALLAGGLAGLASTGASAQADDFYRGRNIDLIVGFPPGGSNNLYARVLATHLGKHIPGNPGIIVRNMPGAGSMTAAAHVFNSAAQDGTTLAIVAPTLPLNERLTPGGLRFKSSEFGWVGRINSLVNVIFVRGDSVKTLGDVLTTPVRLSATGAGSAITVYPNALNYILGTKFDIVRGYSGSMEGMLAVDRREVDGHCTGWDTLKTSHPDWIAGKSISLLVQFASKRHPELKDVPTALEFAKTPQQEQMLQAIVNAAEVGTSFFTTPNVPPQRLALLQGAFSRCMEDREFLADIEKLQIGIDPMDGKRLGEIVADVAKVADDLVPGLQQATLMVAGRN
ncbi:MAG: tripartite tricarboxylate transporter family receptor [Hyphomicrobiales bacterium]|nr:tripartite tricarboxylate transporter family receptor [Hyphomicrobiales bacterium]